MLKGGLTGHKSEELTPLIKSKSMTWHKILNKSSKYKDSNLLRSNGCKNSNIEVACELEAVEILYSKYLK